jgi:hypothetical protein
MKNKTLALSVALLCLSQNYLFAQDKLNIKFGKITAADFDLSKSNPDTGAGAVVIADIGRSDFEGNNAGWFSLSFKKHTRIKILSKNGMDASNVEIPLYISGTQEEKVVNLRASTYNLENGKITETALDKKSIFRDKYDKNHITVKFTLPAVKEGAVIEYVYTVTSDFLRNLQPWEFQGTYPVLWSQYEVKVPDFFNYVFLSQGHFPLEHSTETTHENFHMIDPERPTGSSSYNFSSNAVQHRWIARNVPALKTESFTSTIRNHIAKIEFQLSQYRFPNSPIRDIMGNWSTLATELMKAEDFGSGLLKNNNWLDDELRPVVQGVSGKLEKSQKIYAYVRDRYTSTGKRGIGLSASLKATSKNKNGYVADINLLLTAMMKEQGIEAYPVILSTRSHGYTHEFYPLIDRFNHVICAVAIDDRLYYLDASSPSLGFSHLPPECYNGHARMIMPDVTKAIYLSPDSLVERKLTSILIHSEKPGEWTGHRTTHAGYYESIGVREKIKEKGETSFFKSIQTDYTGDMTLSGQKIEQLKDLDAPVKIEYDFAMSQQDDLIYFNPMTWEGYKDNYFKAAKRYYPVEMPYLFDETYMLNLDIPAGYVVDEMPESAKVKLGETDGFFEYLIDQYEGTIRLRSRIKLNRATYAPEEYNILREFFSYVVKKHAESVILKKKS